jgi:hypothetical protein
MTKSIMGMALALICAGSNLKPALAEIPAVGCNGNACDHVSILWINDGYKFFNEGARPVRLGVRSGSPENCGEMKFADLAPGETVFYGPESFCGQVMANYRKGGSR